MKVFQKYWRFLFGLSGVTLKKLESLKLYEKVMKDCRGEVNLVQREIGKSGDEVKQEEG